MHRALLHHENVKIHLSNVAAADSDRGAARPSCRRKVHDRKRKDRSSHQESGKAKTAMDFIDKVASVSSTSGKPYVICIKGAREVKCGEYLKDELKKLEKDKPEKAKAAAEHRLH